MARTKSTPEQLEEKRRLKAEAQEQARLESNLKMELTDLRRKPLPAPRFQYQVGEEIKARTAHWEKLIVKEVLDEGKILLCEIHSIDCNYGKNTPRVRLRYVSHLEVIPSTLNESKTVFNQRKQRPDMISFHNTQLYSLIIHHYNRIDYDTEYQRGRVWTQEDKEKLIDSIFNRVSIGAFALVNRPLKDAFSCEILDGKQRLLTIVEFYEDKFQYKGFYFSELSPEDKHYFLDFCVTMGLGHEDMTLVQKYDYFLRLNTGGKPQSEEHLQKIREKLKELQNENKG